MVSFGNQNQFPSFLAPLGDLLKAFMFLSNLNGFNSSSSPPDQRFAQRKMFFQSVEGKRLKVIQSPLSLSLSLSLSLLMVIHYLFVLLSCFESVYFYALCVSFIFLFGCFSVFALFVFHKNKKLKNQKNTKIVCICIYWYLCTVDDL